METPSSTRRVTRSQTLSAIKSSAPNHHLLSSKKPEEMDSKSRQRKQQALFDITNDSPIVGLAMQTPSSGMMGKRNMSRIKSTPGSGEALLRGQVKNLLQKVEEEADLITKISVESRPFIHLVTSPMGLLAPTPANTPQVLNFSADNDAMRVVITSPVVAGHLRAATSSSSQVEESKMIEEKEESPRITRSLLLDFSDKSEISEGSDCSSVVTQNPEDDNSSVWSMLVNASTNDDEDDEEEQVSSYREEDDEEYYEEEEEEEGGIVDELCEGMRKMNFEGKHIRFVYDTEDEEIVEAKEQSPGVLRLKGFPTPKGKHVRFPAADQ